MMLEADQIHHVLETTVKTASIILNCYLLYLIKYYSTFGVNVYRYLLTIDATLDLCLSLVVLIVQPIGMIGNDYTIIVSNGFFAGRSAIFDQIFITLYGFLLHANVLWIPVQFVYRYRLLCKEESTSTKANFVIATVTTIYALVTFVGIASFCQVRDEFQTNGQYVLNVNDWPLHNGEKKYFAGSSITEWRMFYWLSLWTVTCSGSVAIVIWCEVKIVKSLNQYGTGTQASTQRMHKEFHRALLAMAICPLVTTTVPVFYFLISMVFQLSSGQVSAFMTTASTCITQFNPLTTIIFLRCYRRVAVRLISCGRHQSHVTPGEIQATQSVSGAIQTISIHKSDHQINRNF
ncbi:serpentine type 7TM GPCR chemoreceptor srd domain-containing protein [Ditylenchus destructor]|uniref:Serpentine type 7TM GPCR chemoreceptor srd domain-containing protein n=1 Tax=Ditylenchus destructor TaxID=166010 RepID=A0AAD4MU47_9BILA|nr:serpentine type 7TM GPCR chemoreceptor srd domain-containing protein [Ditylenchus destructor]